MGISKHDKQALADLFIHMGVPLVVAIQTLESWSGGEVEPQTQRAEKLAKLLNISVDFATKLTKKLEIRDAYTLENVRGKIIRIVTPIIGDAYIKNGETPTQDTLQGLTDLFDVLLSFADSVSPTDEKGSRPTKMANMIEACDPLLNIIRENNLGMDDAQILQESVSGLKTRAEQLAPTLGLDHAIETGLFRALVRIYTSCYQLIANKNGTIDDVWNECDQRIVLIHGLTFYVADNTGIEKSEISPVKNTSENETANANVIKNEQSKETDQENSDEDGKPDIFKLSDKDSKVSKTEVDTKSLSEEKAKSNDDDENDDDFNPMAFFSSNG